MTSDTDAPATDLLGRLADLQASLRELRPGEAVPAALGMIFNSLLAQASRIHPESLAGIPPVEVGPVGCRVERALLLGLTDRLAATVAERAGAGGRRRQGKRSAS